MKVSRPVWGGGKAGDGIKGLPIAIHKGAVIQVRGVNVKVLQAIPQQKNLLLIVEAVENVVPARTMLHVRPDGQIIDFPEGWAKN